MSCVKENWHLRILRGDDFRGVVTNARIVQRGEVGGTLISHRSFPILALGSDFGEPFAVLFQSCGLGRATQRGEPEPRVAGQRNSRGIGAAELAAINVEMHELRFVWNVE